MATNSNIISNLNVGSSTFNAASTATSKSNSDVSKNQFLQLLVTQLKNQDPMDPMKDDQFAVNLAQFSQLEQLMDINSKIASDTSTLSSLASFLGQEVTLNNGIVESKNGDAGKITYDLANQSNGVKLEFLDADDQIVKSIDLGQQTAGKHSVDLAHTDLPDGTYKVQVSGINPNGLNFSNDVYVTGIVSGFVPGPDPSLLIGSREFKTSEIKEVKLAGAA